MGGDELIERVCETVNQLLKLVDNVPMSYDQLRLLASEHTLLDLGCVHIPLLRLGARENILDVPFVEFVFHACNILTSIDACRNAMTECV